MLASAAAKRALVIGLGTGSTAGWLGVVPTMERVDVVELEPVVLDVARACARRSTRTCSTIRRSSIAIGDAREVLLTTRGTYDIIFSEPSNPYRAGIASLFTTRVLRSGGRAPEPRRHLRAVGAGATTIDATTLRTIYATIGSVFPHVETWWTGPGRPHAGGVAREPIVHDADRIRARLRQPGFGDAVHLSLRAETAEGFYARHVASEDLARRLADGIEVLNTDDRTVIEYGFARAVHDKNRHASDAGHLWQAGRALGASYPKRLRGMLDRQLIDANRATFYESFINLPQRYFAQDVSAGNYRAAVDRWRAARWHPVNSQELASLALVLANSGSPAAETYARALAQHQPIEADVIMARLRLREQKYAEAAELLVRAFNGYAKNPWPRLDIMRDGLVAVQELAAADRCLGRASWPSRPSRIRWECSARPASTRTSRSA